MKKSIIWITFAMLMSIFSCKKDKIENKNSNPEALSAAEVEILDNLPEATGFSSTSVVLPDGEILDSYLQEIDTLFYNQWKRITADPYDNLGPQGARNLLIARISDVALNLTDRSKHQKPDEGAGKPAQNGLAYSWGSKSYTVRQTPPGGGTVCTEKIYGLDCSGFIYQLFTNAGVSLLSGPANSQRQPNVLQNAIKSSIPALNKVKVEDLGKISTSKFETGDIIYWTNSSGVATHIGIVLKDVGGNLAVFQSNGSPGNSADDCSKNMGETRGARRLQLNDPYWFGQGKAYGITRINADISGKWDLFLKCSNEPNDIAKINLDFPTDKNTSFSINKDWIDYDGDALRTLFEFSYDNSTNILSCIFTTTTQVQSSFIRKDSFTIKLEKDETGNISCTNLQMTPTGFCDLQVRLKNNE